MDKNHSDEGANGHLKPASSAGKGKGKGKDSSLSGRILDSTRLAMHSIGSTQSINTVAAEGKGSASVMSSNNSLHAEQQRSTGTSSSHRNSQLATQESIKDSSQSSRDTTEAFNSFLSSSHQQPAESNAHLSHSAFEAQQGIDGNDVVNLLSVPDEELELESVSETLSEDEVARLRHAFFAKNYAAAEWDALLNFVPGFISKPEESRERSEYLGTSDPLAARDTWFRQWEDVLSSYTDEVWGDLTPLVAAARAEISGVQDPVIGSTEAGTKALNRLRQILAHVRGSE